MLAWRFWDASWMWIWRIWISNGDQWVYFVVLPNTDVLEWKVKVYTQAYVHTISIPHTCLCTCSSIYHVGKVKMDIYSRAVRSLASDFGCNVSFFGKDEKKSPSSLRTPFCNIFIKFVLWIARNVTAMFMWGWVCVCVCVGGGGKLV